MKWHMGTNFYINKNGKEGAHIGKRSAPSGENGIASCSSFSWAMKPDHFALATNEVEPADKAKAKKPVKFIIDEYGRKFTIAEFGDILSECPVRFYDMIGGEGIL